LENYITSSSRNDAAYESAELLMMESVAQYLTRIVRQTEQVQALAKAATVTLASPQSDEPSRFTAEQESSPLAQYENYLRDGEGLQPYIPLYCSFRGDIVIQEREYAREYALSASGLQPVREFQDSCVFWVDSSFARTRPHTSADPTKRTSAAAAVVYKIWPNKKEWKFRAFGLARVHSSNLAELFAIKAALEVAAEIAQKHNSLRKLTIFTDSQAALTEISKFPYATSVAENIVSSFIKAALLLYKLCIRLEVRWVPGHKRVPGNVAADSLAKRARKSLAILPVNSTFDQEALFPLP
jgi:ribonuclease HI